MSTDSFRLLIIEDNTQTQEIATQNLSQNYLIKKSSDECKAISELQSGYLPDLIVFDLNTAKSNGLNFIAQLKSNSLYSSIPILILSGDDTAEERLKCLEAGADDYITKPYNQKELDLRLKVLLRKKEEFFKGSHN